MVCRFITLAWITVFAGPALGHGAFSDSGITGPRYAVTAKKMDDLATVHSDWATVINYGESVRGRTLKMIRIASPNMMPVDSKRAVLISGATHGNEYLNIADRLPGHFLENRKILPNMQQFLDEGGVIYIVPILNPDGYDADQRGNANGKDLNRDFALLPLREPNFEEPETRLLTEALDVDIQSNNVDLKVTVDYHCCDGSLLFPWSYTRESLPGPTLDAHRTIAQLMQRLINPNYEYGSTGQVLGYYPKGTSKDFYYAKYNALAFTFEGSYRQENKKFPQHVQWWEAIFQELNVRNLSH